MQSVLAYSVLQGFARDNQQRRRLPDWPLPTSGKSARTGDSMLIRLIRRIANTSMTKMFISPVWGSS